MRFHRAACAASLLSTLMTLSGCDPKPVAAPPPKPTALVDAARIAAADPAEWLSYGRTYDEQRFSPLDNIDSGNVAQLGLAWAFDLDSAHRAQESTPLVIDGVMYVTSAWSKLFALDAKTGRQKWVFDPRVPGEAGVNACCDVVNRGVAAWNGKLYLGTLDGRLVAVDAATGKQVWDVKTVPDNTRYTITGAPRVFDGKVLIGNGGAELGVRGFVTAYDAETGKQLWRFYTVPGDPSLAIRESRARESRQDLERSLLEAGRRRHGVGFHRLRPGSSTHLHRRRQRQPVESEAAQPGGRRQPLSIVDRGVEGRRPANTSGISRRRRVKPGTTPRRSP